MDSLKFLYKSSLWAIPFSALLVTIIVRSAPKDTGGYFPITALCFIAIGIVGFIGYLVRK